MIFAQFDDVGAPVGFWPEELFPKSSDGERHPDIPVTATPITHEQWLDLIGNQGRRRWENGEVVPYEPPVPPPPPAPRSTAMWRARTIMKVTSWEGGTLFQAVQDAIAGLSDPLQQATAEEALERGDIFDRDGVFVPMLAAIVGIGDEQLDELMAQAAALPA